MHMQVAKIWAVAGVLMLAGAASADECDCALPANYVDDENDICLAALDEPPECVSGWQQMWINVAGTPVQICVPTCNPSTTCSAFASAVLEHYRQGGSYDLDCFPTGLKSFAQVRATFCEWRMKCLLDTECDRDSNGTIDGADLEDFISDIEDQTNPCCDGAAMRAKAICMWIAHCMNPPEGAVGVPCGELKATIEALISSGANRDAALECLEDACEVPPDGDPNPIEKPGPFPPPGGGSGCGGSGSPLHITADAANPATSDPVDLAYGHKLESVTDLVVPVAGIPFRLSRDYSSNTQYQGPGAMGEHWSSSVLRDLKFSEVEVTDPSPGTCCKMTGGGMSGGSIATTDCVCSAKIRVTGQTAQYIEKGCIENGDGLWPVWRVVEPGAWSMHFYREEDVSDACGDCDQFDAALIGRLFRVEDPYGNYHEHSYALLPQVGGGTTARVSRVDCYTSADQLQARIHFVYNFAGSGQPSGTLARVEVWRPRTVSDGGEPPSLTPVEVITQRAHYTYYSYSGGGQPAHLGTTGDLIQVRVDERVDPSPGDDAEIPVWRSRITQYRYHGGLASEIVTDTDGDDYIEQGAAHQLKMVIEPEQFEFYAQRRAADAGGVHDAVEYAGDLLLLDDNDTDAALLKPVELAAKIVAKYEDDGQKRVLEQYVLAGCGCGSGGTQGMRQDFEYFQYDEGRTTKMTESKRGTDPLWTAYKVAHVDLEKLGDEPLDGEPDARGWYLVNQAVSDPTEAGPFEGMFWVTHYQHSDDSMAVLERLYMPSATDEYIPYHVDGDPVPPSYTPKTDGGLVYAYGYNSNARQTELRVGKGEQDDNDIEDYDLISHTEYSATTGMEHLPTVLRRVRIAGATGVANFGGGGLDPDDVETTTFEYGMHSETHTDIAGVAWVKTTVEAELPEENGPDDGGGAVTYSSWEVLDPRGLNTWSIAADGSYTKRIFDNDSGGDGGESVSRTGAPVIVIRNASRSGDGFPDDEWAPAEGLPSDRNSDGGSLTNSMGRDVLGRVQETVTPGGVTRVTAREMRNPPEGSPGEGLRQYAEVSLPFEYEEGVFDGPAKVVWMNSVDKIFQVIGAAPASTYVPAVTAQGYRQIYSEYQLDAELLSRSETVMHVSGLVDFVRKWHDPNETEGFFETAYSYDSLGRVSESTSGVGTRTGFEYDFLGRINVTKKSSTAEGAVWATVETRYYDSDTTTEGIGDGNLTYVVQHADGTTSRPARTYYDFRNRPVAVEHSLPPHNVIAYDNLDRIVERASIDEPIGSDAFDLTDDYLHRISYARTCYSQRGQVFKREEAILPAEDASSKTYLSTNFWLDASGREVGLRRHSASAVKTTYDGHGRNSAVYETDGSGFGTFEAVHTSHASVTTADHVIRQTETRYISGEAGCKGLPDLITVRLRPHDYMSTGTLSGGNGVVTLFGGCFYDGAGRLSAVVDFGTRQASFSTGGTSPTITQGSVPTSSPEEHVTSRTYNANGLIETVTTPGGAVTRFLRDGLGRAFATIENYVDAAVSWADAPSPETGKRWIASGVGTTDGTDKVTSRVFDASGNVVKYVAHQNEGVGDPGTADQVTTYSYGVEAGGNPDDSALWSNDLLLSVTYPDTGVITYAYNRLGEVTYLTDQNGTEHSYVRDLLGRVELDCIESFGAGIDEAIACIEREYDDAGRLERVTSLDDGDSPVNEVRFAYTPLHQVAEVWQDHNGAVEVDTGEPDTDTRVVRYAYDTVDSTAGNYTRVSEMDYPRNINSGSPVTAVLEYQYGAGLNDAISRVENLEIDDWVEVVKYDYIGSGVFAQVDYVGPSGSTDVQLDRTASADGKRNTQGHTTQSSGVYPGLDRFGRVQRQDWVDGGFDEGPDDYPDRPQVVALGYAYDAAGNRTQMVDQRPQSNWKHSFEFEYDGLHRLTDADRGVWDGDSLESQAGGQEWTLDMLGNWMQWKKDANFGGSFSAAETEDRTHSEVNELDSREADSTPIEAIAYDAAGNLRTRTSGTVVTTYVHDGWNRLVRIYSEDGEDPEMQIMAQQFNGLNWRTWKAEDTLEAPQWVYNPPPIDDDVLTQSPLDGVLDKTIVYAYNASWQIVEVSLPSFRGHA